MGGTTGYITAESQRILTAPYRLCMAAQRMKSFCRADLVEATNCGLSTVNDWLRIWKKTKRIEFEYRDGVDIYYRWIIY